MKTTINTQALTNAIAVASNYTHKSGDDAGKIVIEYVSSNMIAIKASDYSESMIMKVYSPSVEQFEQFSINSKDAHTLLKNVKTDEVLIETTDEHFFIKSGKSRAKISKYYAIPIITNEETVINKVTLTKGFIEALIATEHAIDTSNPKAELTGAYIHCKNGHVKVVSTDTKRLSVQSVGLSDSDFEFILPKSALKSFYKNFPENTILNISNSEVFAQNEFQRYSSKKYNLKFVNYSKIIPTSFTQTFNISKRTLAEVVKDSSALDGKIMLDISNGRIKSSALNGSFETEKELETGNTNIKFSIESKFILDYLAVCTEDSIQIGFNEEVLPIALIQSPELCEIIMPITVTK